MRSRVRFVVLRGVPIYRQLLLEEYLLRCTSDNYVLVNSGMPSPAIVVGFSGKIKELVHVEAVARDGIQLIRRYSGGGTVVCDASTLFVSLVMNHAHVSAKPYPRDIMTWTADTLYAPLFGRFTAAAFALRENDYVFGDAKFGGNAQSISRDRWVHHTSFLWDFDSRMMGYLQQPRKQPEYRLNREHGAFLTRLSSYIPSVSDFEAALKVEFEKHFEVDSVSQQQCEAIVADLRLSNSEATVCRTKLESAEAVLSEMRRVPSLIRTGPSCVNL